MWRIILVCLEWLEYAHPIQFNLLCFALSIVIAILMLVIFLPLLILLAYAIP